MSGNPLEDPPIDRAPLRDQVYDIIVGRIVAGALAPGERLSDSAMAEDLGVSRTPVREALLRLEAEGMLRADHNRGFFVPPLASVDAEELYPILWSLESLAVGLAVPMEQDRIARLRELNRRFAEATEPLERQRLDRAFHETLCAAAGNERLDRILDGLRTALLRYELAFMAGGGDPEASVRDHTELVEFLEAGDVQGAQAKVLAHWQEGLASLRSHLE